MKNKESVEDEYSFDAKLHITQRKTGGRVHITITRGEQELVVVLIHNQWNAVYINGVGKSIEEGRTFLREQVEQVTLLPSSEFPRYGVKDTQTHAVSYQSECKTARLWNDDLIVLTKEIMDENLVIRRVTPNDLADLLGTASSIEWSYR